MPLRARLVRPGRLFQTHGRNLLPERQSRTSRELKSASTANNLRQKSLPPEREAMKEPRLLFRLIDGDAAGLVLRRLFRLQLLGGEGLVHPAIGGLQVLGPGCL